MRVRVKVKEHFKVLDFQFRYFFFGILLFRDFAFRDLFFGFFYFEFYFFGIFTAIHTGDQFQILKVV